MEYATTEEVFNGIHLYFRYVHILQWIHWQSMFNQQTEYLETLGYKWESIYELSWFGCQE